MVDKQAIACAAGIFAAGLHAEYSWADGSFLQADLSPTAAGTVAAVERGQLTYSGVYSDTDGNAAATASLGYRIPLGAIAALKIGPSVGATKDKGEAFGGPELGLRAAVDRYTPTSFGAVYLLGEVNTIDNAWFSLAQVSLGQTGLSAEVSRGGSDTYDEAALGVNARIGDGPVSLRAGYRLFAEEAFIGVSVNTF